MRKPITLAPIYIDICIKEIIKKIKLSIEYKKTYINYTFLGYAKMFC